MGGRDLMDIKGVDKMGEFSWTLFTNYHGHFCPLESLFWGEFSWTFLVNSHEDFLK